MRDETEKDILASQIRDAKYDEEAKRLFHNKEILAPVMKFAIPEYKDFETEEIIQMIEQNSIKAVPVEDIPIGIKGEETEMSSITEKLIRYDVHFVAKNPLLSTDKILVQLHFDFEIQNTYLPRNPAYPIVTRGVYYAAREISQQLGTLTQKTNYGDVQKVYSVWICNDDIPEELQNTMTLYQIEKKDIYGTTNEPKEDYDLLSIVIIRRGKSSGEQDIFKYLEGVFAPELSVINKYVNVSNNPVVKKEVEAMSGLGAALVEKGEQKGERKGEKRERARIIKKMQKRGDSYEEIADFLEISKEEVIEIEESILEKV